MSYQLGIEREKKKKMYKLYSERIIQFLSGRGQAQLLKDEKLYDLFIKDIEISSTDDILTDDSSGYYEECLGKNW